MADKWLVEQEKFLDQVRSEVQVRSDEDQVIVDLKRVRWVMRSEMVQNNDFRELRILW